MRIAAYLSAAALGCAQLAARPAAAETPAPPASVFRLAAPPTGFHPETASDAALAAYGLPARPHGGTAAVAWLHAMTAARTYVAPMLRLEPHRHGAAVMQAGRRDGAYNTTNWSGQVLTNGATSYGGTSYSQVLAQWIISAVQQPVGSCGGTDVSATWVGIDGFGGSSDVSQAGTEADAACSGGVTTQTFYPWFEWYPADSYEIVNFPVSRGGAIFVVVQINGAASATATYVNLQNGQYTSIGFAAPGGTALHGNSAEWIVERPGATANSLGTLADFGQIAMYSEVAILYSQMHTASYNTPGTPSAGQTLNGLTMVDAGGNVLATAASLGVAAQLVQAAGATK